MTTTSYYQPAYAGTNYRPLSGTVAMPIQPGYGSAPNTSGYVPATGVVAAPTYPAAGYNTLSPSTATTSTYSPPSTPAATFSAPATGYPASSYPAASYPPAAYPNPTQPAPNYGNTIPPTPQPNLVPQPGTTTQVFAPGAGTQVFADSPKSTVPGAAATQMFGPGSAAATPTNLRPIPDPDLEENATPRTRVPAPRINGKGDQTTSVPSARPWACSLIRYNKPTAEATFSDADGWQAAR